MSMLDLVAVEVAVSGRTLRRAATRGLIRAARPSARKFVVPPSELAYVRAHWPLLSGLVEALRKLPNVRLAVVFGSVARGEAQPDSDLDLLVRLRRDNPQERAELVDALNAASGRRVQLVSLAQAEEAQLLLADVMFDGRVLVDREGDWPRLQRRRTQTIRRATAEDERLTHLAWSAPDALEQVRSGTSIGRDSARLLPRPIKVRLAAIRTHYQALALVLERTPKDQFVQAARGSDPAQLAAHVYPLERAFEIVANYVGELNEFGLEAATLAPGDRPANLRLLVREKAVSSARAQRWRGILEARNELQHAYPDVRAGGIYEAAVALVDDLPGYLREYVAWMRRLGFGEQQDQRTAR